jgi:hypothetical protein
MFHLVASCHLNNQVNIMIYPGLQMVCADDRLFKVHIEWDNRQDVWAQYLKLLRDGQVDTTCQIFLGGNWPFIASDLLGPNLGFHVPIHEKSGEDRWTCRFKGVHVMIYLIRIQRMVKRRQAHARRVRLLAVLMCLHDRLGQDSLLGRLPVDLIYFLL